MRHYANDLLIDFDSLQAQGRDYGRANPGFFEGEV